jgi:hypothetical protein
MFQYALKLRYPNGRTFDYYRESDNRLAVGNEFDAFGRTWRIACDVPPTRFKPEYPSTPEAFLCHPVGEDSPPERGSGLPSRPALHAEGGSDRKI